MLDGWEPSLLWHWIAFEQLEPFEEKRGDWRAASIVWAIASANRDPNKTAPYEIKDFLLNFGEAEPRKKQTAEEQMKILTMIAYAHGEPDGPVPLV
jgi:hypothetical protein